MVNQDFFDSDPDPTAPLTWLYIYNNVNITILILVSINRLKYCCYAYFLTGQEKQLETNKWLLKVATKYRQ